MCEDYGRAISSSNLFTNKLLLKIRRLLHQYKKKLDDFDLPSINVEYLENTPLPRTLEDELSIQISDDDLRSIECLDAQRRIAFDTIIETIVHNQLKLFFFDGSGGTGKTSIQISDDDLRSIECLDAQRRIAFDTIIETIVHNQLKLSSLMVLVVLTELADLIRRASTIVWDEAPMENRYAFESISKSFQDVMENQLVFGGKTMVFVGDFRQVLLVVKRGSKAGQIATRISRLTFWYCV
ncbi:uncharacterized protein [Primulina huaijiensis]|uniref:uncharacterized protein n=1 Tax=Primulina huaijiensis TaxID=1492673 RepID=UPI003CC78FB2